MKLTAIKKNGGYSQELARQCISIEEEVRLLTLKAQLVRKFVDDKATDEIEWYKYWFIQEGSEPFEVKLKAELTDTSFLDKMIFDGIEATVYKNNIFFRANIAMKGK